MSSCRVWISSSCTVSRGGVGGRGGSECKTVDITAGDAIATEPAELCTLTTPRYMLADDMQGSSVLRPFLSPFFVLLQLGKGVDRCTRVDCKALCPYRRRSARETVSQKEPWVNVERGAVTRDRWRHASPSKISENGWGTRFPWTRSTQNAYRAGVHALRG
jgi:hypothetical protein